MATKKNLRQLATMKAIYLDRDVMAYRPSKGFIVLDGEEDGYIVNYITFDKGDKAWVCEYTNGYEETRITDTRSAFRVFKQV